MTYDAAMDFIRKLLGGVSSVLTVTSSPLYRYPYRSGGEALRGDWLRVGKDIRGALHLEDQEEP